MKADGKSKGVDILFSKTCNFTWQADYKDLEGRLILVKGFIDSHLFSFISYYAPNKGQLKFFQSMWATLNPLLECTTILGWDCNMAFDQGPDKSNLSKTLMTRPTRASLKIARLVHSQGLADVLQEMNPMRRDYSHFSSPHHSYARIDDILMSTHHLSNVSSSKIIDTTLSDHSIVTFRSLKILTTPNILSGG